MPTLDTLAGNDSPQTGPLAKRGQMSAKHQGSPELLCLSTFPGDTVCAVKPYRQNHRPHWASTEL